MSALILRTLEYHFPKIFCTGKIGCQISSSRFLLVNSSSLPDEVQIPSPALIYKFNGRKIALLPVIISSSHFLGVFLTSEFHNNIIVFISSRQGLYTRYIHLFFIDKFNNLYHMPFFRGIFL